MIARYFSTTLCFLVVALSLANAAPSNLPRCVDSESDLAEMETIQNANRKTSRKYDGYRQILSVVSPLELAARLAYAETLAANCPAQNEQVVDLVTTVIGNRIRIRGGDAGSVVFQRDQFSSSLNIYPESRYRDFLCPKQDDLWRMVLAKMRANLDSPEPDTSTPKDAVNYYLYQHSTRFTAPDWKLQEVSSEDEKVRQCIRVFRSSGWR